MPDLDRTDRRLLDRLQTEVPLVATPYAELGGFLGIPEGEVRRRIAALREARIIRQISAIFDSRKLGYQSSLVAFDVVAPDLAGVASRVSAHPGVSHNYQRDYDYNLWFTIAVPPGRDLNAEVGVLARQAGVRRWRVLPTLTVFKVGVQLEMEQDGGSLRTGGLTEPEPVRSYPAPTSEEIEAIRVLQRDLPATERPFAQLAADRGQSEAAVLRAGRAFLEDGRMRRFAAVLYHREAGFTHNAMVMWRVEDEEIARVGALMASCAAVSHCYRRPAFPDLPFNLYTMIHGREADRCEQTVQHLAEATGVRDYAVVYSTKEFKKVRVRYFEEENGSATTADCR